jgi:hypothetical protein
MVAPDSPEPLQTLASVRISQLRIDDARATLTRSLELWKDLPAGDPRVPGFPMRVSLARLLLEAEMEDEAIEVLERLVDEDDESIEVWYLGGWGLYIMGEKKKEFASTNADKDRDDWRALWIASRDWLQKSLMLYQMLEYEDDRLRDHAKELIGNLKCELESSATNGGGDAGGNEDQWEDVDQENDGDRDEDGSRDSDASMNGT